MLQWKARFTALLAACTLIAAWGGFFDLVHLARNLGW
jgi:hypothetical protein